MSLSSSRLRAVQDPGEGSRAAELYTLPSDWNSDKVLGVVNSSGTELYAGLDSPRYTKARSKFFKSGSSLGVVCGMDDFADGDFEAGTRSWVSSGTLSITRTARSLVGPYWGAYSGVILKPKTASTGAYVRTGFSLSSAESHYSNSQAALEFDYECLDHYIDNLFVARITNLGGSVLGSFPIPAGCGKGRIEWTPAGVQNYYFQIIVVADTDTGATNNYARSIRIDNIRAGVPLVYKVARKLTVLKDDTTEDASLRTTSYDLSATVSHSINYGGTETLFEGTIIFDYDKIAESARYGIYNLSVVAANTGLYSTSITTKLFIDGSEITGQHPNIAWYLRLSESHAVKITATSNWLFGCDVFAAYTALTMVENTL